MASWGQQGSDLTERALDPIRSLRLDCFASHSANCKERLTLRRNPKCFVFESDRNTLVFLS